MSPTYKFCVFLLCLNALVLDIFGYTLLSLDLDSDKGELINYNCHYSKDYEDFWTFGCKTKPKVEIFPNYKGYWTQCKRKCTISLNTAEKRNLDVSRLRIKSYIEGSPQIIVTGKYSTNSTEKEEIVTISAPVEPNNWFETMIEMGPHPDARIITLTLTEPLADEFILIDRITIENDLDEDEPTTYSPTTPDIPVAPTTTASPETPMTLIEDPNIPTEGPENPTTKPKDGEDQSIPSKSSPNTQAALNVVFYISASVFTLLLTAI